MAVLVGKQAPDFNAVAIMGNNEINTNFSLKKHIENKYAVLFFYPLDFTFVCPSEILAFDHRLEEFKKRNVEVISVSIDSHYSHLAWKSVPVDKGGIGPVRFPMVADIKHEICKAYDVEAEGGVAFRGSFLIDTKGMVQHQVVNNLPLGRNIDEMIRMVDAVQFHEEHGEVCPAGWNKGKAGMNATPEGVAKFLAAHAQEL